ncbi:MAG: citrate (Si)-synthase [Planctomycetes bacterium]|nr:citrate (Si)-synthase [Planctomycetota bacterium]
MKILNDKLAKVLAAKRDELKAIGKEHGDKVVGQIAVEQVLGGARGMVALVCDTSTVPADKGLHIRGIPIGELAERLPEEIYYLLLTGELPDAAAVKEINAEFAQRNKVPSYVFDVLDAMPADSHPMAMLNTAVLVMQRESVFAKRYESGMPKDEYWQAALEDGLNLLARLPGIAAAIYRKRFKKGPRIESNPKLDWGANYAHMLGIDDPKGEFKQLMRLYLVLHCDHGAGNVSACTASTVGSALSDLYYSLSAGLNGLAGPLHGLANQECLKWVTETMEKFGGVPSVAQITKYAEETIAAKRVVPGYGHAVLRVEDPRFTAFVKFGKAHFPEDPVFKTVQNVYQAVPAVLKQHPKIKNPWPNVDAASGSLLCHYGLTEADYYTVLFSVSRALGITAQAVLARGMGLPIFRPSDTTTKKLREAAEKSTTKAG